MIPLEAKRLALRQALRSRVFDHKLCLARARALKRGADAIAAMDLDILMRRLRDWEGAGPPPAQRAKLLAALDRINLDGSAIAIRRRSDTARPAPER